MEIPLRDHFEARVVALEKEVGLRAVHAEQALVLAKEASDYQRHMGNEVRAQLRDQAERFIARETADVQHAAMNTHIDRLTTRMGAIEQEQANMRGRMAMIGAGLGLFFTIVQLGMHFLGAK